VAINLVPLMASKGLSRSQAAEILMVGAAAAIFAKILSGMASDRFGIRFPLFFFSILPAAGVFLVGFAPNVLVAAGGYVLISLAGAQHTMMAAVCASEFAKSQFGRAFGLMTMFAPLATLGQFVLAKWQEAAGAYQPGIVGLGTMAAIGGLICIAYSQHRRATGGAI